MKLLGQLKEEGRERERETAEMKQEQQESEVKRKRMEKEIQELRAIKEKLESEGSEELTSPRPEQEAHIAKLEVRLQQMKELITEKIATIGDKDEIIAKHEAGVLYYEQTLQEM